MGRCEDVFRAAVTASLDTHRFIDVPGFPGFLDIREKRKISFAFFKHDYFAVVVNLICIPVYLLEYLQKRNTLHGNILLASARILGIFEVCVKRTYSQAAVFDEKIFHIGYMRPGACDSSRFGIEDNIAFIVEVKWCGDPNHRCLPGGNLFLGCHNL